jgi:hypothetical protein
VRRFGFGLGLVLIVIAAAAAVAQLFSFLVQGAYAPIAIGAIWYNIHANSLVGFQALIENRLSPALWPAILWVLELPAWLVLGLAGALLLLACRRRGRRFDY